MILVVSRKILNLVGFLAFLVILIYSEYCSTIKHPFFSDRFQIELSGRRTPVSEQLLDLKDFRS